LTTEATDPKDPSARPGIKTPAPKKEKALDAGKPADKK
jgi:hypothetical protein